MGRRRSSLVARGVALLAVPAVFSFLWMPLVPKAASPSPGVQEQVVQEEAAALSRREQEEQHRIRREEHRQRVTAERQTRTRDIEIATAYWRIGSGYQSTLIVNNTSPESFEVQPVIFGNSGERIEGKPFTATAMETLTLSLGDLIGPGREGHGQLALRYRGVPDDLNARIQIVHRAQSVSTDHSLEDRITFLSSRFESVFFLPTATAQPELVLSNNSDVALGVALIVAPEPENPLSPRQLSGPAGPLVVNARSTRVVDLRSFLPTRNGPYAAALTVAHSGAPGDVRVHGTVVSPEGFSTNMRLIEPGALDGSRLFAPILPVSPISGGLNPILLLHNTRADAVKAEIAATFMRNGRVETMSWGDAVLPAGSARHVNLTGRLRTLPPGASNVGISLSMKAGDRPAEGVLTDFLLMDESGSGVYQEWPKGYSAHSHTVHGEPFRIGGDMNTILTVANTGNAPLPFSVALFWKGGGSYSYRTEPLMAGEVRYIDIRELRDNQVKGYMGATIAQDVTEGHARIGFPPIPKTTAHSGHAGHGVVTPVGFTNATVVDAGAKISFTSCDPGGYPVGIGLVADPNSLELIVTGRWNVELLLTGWYGWSPYIYEVHDWVRWGNGNSYGVYLSDLEVIPTGDQVVALDYPSPYPGALDVTAYAPGSVAIEISATISPVNPEIGSPLCMNLGLACEVEGGAIGPELTVQIAPEPTLTLVATGVTEDGKPTHYISLMGAGDVLVTATATNFDPAAIVWAGGSPGANNTQRLVSRAVASNTVVTASFGLLNASVTIHVVDATPPPPAAPNTPKNLNLRNANPYVSIQDCGGPPPPPPPGGGPPPPQLYCFGRVTWEGEAALDPVLIATAHFEANYWVFRLDSLTSPYDLRILQDGGIGPAGLPMLSAFPYPLPPGPDSWVAWIDLDTSGLIPANPQGAVKGPRRYYFWVPWISEAHEVVHFAHFATTAWPVFMAAFESEMENNDGPVIRAPFYFDCANQPTITKGTIEAQKLPFWVARAKDYRGLAVAAWAGGGAHAHELHAHGFTNPLYPPIRDAIPFP